MPSPSAKFSPSRAWSRSLNLRCPATRLSSPPLLALARLWPASASQSNRVFYCPLDLPWAVSAYLNALQPHLLILAETEFWPNLLHGCFSRDIPVAVVNARISNRSWPRYKRLRWLWRSLLSSPEPRARSKPNRRRPPPRARLRSRPRLRQRQSQIRRARCSGIRSHPLVKVDVRRSAIRRCRQHA